MSAGTVVVFVSFLSIVARSRASSLYDNQSSWPGECTIGRSQSPILINTSTTVSGSFSPLVLQNWNLPLYGIFKDTGKTVQFTENPGAIVPTIIKNGITYYVCQFHFHWGSDNNGSEHQIDNTKYGAELHMVSAKDLTYCSNLDAQTAPDAILVIGVLYKAAVSPANAAIWNSLMVPTIYGLSNSVASVKYSDLLPSSLDYYFYNGSLTVPGCGEVVQWYLLKNTIDIPIAFLNTMRTVQTTSGSNVTLPCNSRNLQALNGRTVYSCQGTGCITSPGVGEKASVIMMTVVGCLAIYLAN
ncbi:hypothetical protein EMCRGX_G031369 [Ephydatia muelleri]